MKRIIFSTVGEALEYARWPGPDCLDFSLTDDNPTVFVKLLLWPGPVLVAESRLIRLGRDASLKVAALSAEPNIPNGKVGDK